MLIIFKLNCWNSKYYFLKIIQKEGIIYVERLE